MLMKRITTLLSSLLFCAAFTASAQEKTTTIIVKEKDGDKEKTTIITDSTTKVKRKKSYDFSIGSDGVVIRKKSKDSLGSDSVRAKPNPRLKIQWGMVDLGFNRLDDRTSAATLAAQGVTQEQHDNIFKLREGKSVNVNVWIVNGRLRLNETRRQKWYVTSGLGLQMYNFRFSEPYQYTSASPAYPVALDAKYKSFEKNKLGFTYASIPLGLLGKTRVGNKWLVYGGGVMGGLRIASWTKLKTDEFGKEKNHDPFNFRDFNAGAYGEIGVDHLIRLYATYQFTPLAKSGVEQYPFAIGVRFLGL